MSDFAKDKVFWTKNMNVKLVRYIESRPYMWSPKHPEYNSMKRREKTYAKFASKYENLLTAQAVKDRWTNIRCTFGHYLRKKRLKQLQGYEDFKVNWHLWNECQFLMRANRKQTDKHDLPGHANVKEKNNDHSDEDFENHGSKPSSQCLEISESLVKIFKNVKNDEFLLDNSTHGQIGRLVAERLSQMNSYDAASVSCDIMNVLLKYDSNNPYNPNNIDRLAPDSNIFQEGINTVIQ